MPEPLLKEDNVLAIAVENYEDHTVEPPSMKILPYYVANKLELKIGF